MSKGLNPNAAVLMFFLPVRKELSNVHIGNRDEIMFVIEEHLERAVTTGIDHFVLIHTKDSVNLVDSMKDLENIPILRR